MTYTVYTLCKCFTSSLGAFNESKYLYDIFQND